MNNKAFKAFKNKMAEISKAVVAKVTASRIAAEGVASRKERLNKLWSEKEAAYQAWKQADPELARKGILWCREMEIHRGVFGPAELAPSGDHQVVRFNEELARVAKLCPIKAKSLEQEYEKLNDAYWALVNN